jgi:hypothetical protein
MGLRRLQAERSEMDTTNTTLIIVGVVILLVVLGVAGMITARKQRTQRLQEKFGPEYDHALERAGDETQAERELEERIAHVKALNIRTLSAEEVNDYKREWQMVQTEFVDEPLTALQKADRLIREAMKAKGYPVEDFEERAALLSVDYPELVRDYRAMHRIAIKQARETVSTEDMREAMVHGRALFENLMKQEPKEEKINQKERI